MDPFVGEIRAFGFDYAPRGWALCEGQLLQIRTNTALFAVLGTQYGGDGRTTFGIPNLSGRSIVGVGQGRGLSAYNGGQISGVDTVALLASQIPLHNHRLNYKVVANSNTPMTATPSSAAFLSRTTSSASAAATGFAKPTTALNATLATDTIGLQDNGGSAPHENRQPYLVMRYCIATQGIFPQRA